MKTRYNIQRKKTEKMIRELYRRIKMHEADAQLARKTSTYNYSNLADLINVALGACLEDLERPLIKERMERGVNPQLWAALRNSMSDRAANLNENYSLPLVENKISKSQMVKELPKEILDQVWSCRQPVEDKQCGQCESCKQLNKAKEENES